ncbi:MAG: putative E3 ubiquitin-protein ligase [Stictis urceolatum]|nr:putative E3 ubiquitin-protein ligase [Stictis urceolata]
MVNDLKPAGGKEASATVAQPGPNANKPQMAPEPYPVPRIQKKALTLSVERTRVLVDRSILNYLGHRINYHKDEQKRRNIMSQRSHNSRSVSRLDLDPDNDFALRNGMQSQTAHTDGSLSHEIETRAEVSETAEFSVKVRSSPNTQPTGLAESPRARSYSFHPNVSESRDGCIFGKEPVDGQSDPRYIFRQLENYLVACLNDCECLNAAFKLSRPLQPLRASSEASALAERPKRSDRTDISDSPLFEVDAKTLLLGDIGENGTWWTGNRRTSEKKAIQGFGASAAISDRRSLRFDWHSIRKWYDSILSCGRYWKSQLQLLSPDERSILETTEEERIVEERFSEARHHVQRTLLKATENLLRRPGAGTSAQLHAALDMPRNVPSEEPGEKVLYADDWQIRVAAKVMSLLFSANSHGKGLPQDSNRIAFDEGANFTNIAARQRAHRHFQILPTNVFYNTLLDYADLVADFEAWESRRGRFSFCQYPMFLSIWAKIRIMEHDAHRQMEIKARDAFFTSILSRKAISQYLVLKVRRDCLVDDSLRGVSEVVGTGQEDIKKGLRIEFIGEEGVDAGGLRKEWFLLLVREVFDPDHGLFIYDEESHYCYFNPNSFETSDQFFLVGVVLGLAIYNSTILDVALPPFAFRKLLASAPTYTGPSTTAVRPNPMYTLDDLAEWKPSLARGLGQLLDHEGDVETTFCRDFVADVDRYGSISQVPLCLNGESRHVTESNRREFVELYIRYLLDISVARQYEPFKRGFYTVCGGNALSLFRPEEIELLVRGSDEPMDIASLRAVAIYENWPVHSQPGSGPQTDSPGGNFDVIAWFWDLLESADTETQRKILTFITGSDRIPAMGATSLVIKIVYLTDDYKRYPVARTCFNMLGLHRYRSKSELQAKLWRAVADSEGFGLK